jgi:hypothetical protein
MYVHVHAAEETGAMGCEFESRQTHILLQNNTKCPKVNTQFNQLVICFVLMAGTYSSRSKKVFFLQQNPKFMPACGLRVSDTF